MAERMDSYCGTFYVDTEAESFNGRYPVGPHPYETCLKNQHERLTAVMHNMGTIVSAIRAIEERIYSRDVEKGGGKA